VPLRRTFAPLRRALLAACAPLGACTPIPAEPPGGGPPTPTRDDPVPTARTPDPAPATATACADARPITTASGTATGYVRCGDGAIDRDRILECRNPLRVPACQGTEQHRSCTSDAECTDAPHGFCRGGVGQIGSYCSCVYPCHSDAECAPDQACICPDVGEDGPDIALCAPATCKTGEDCPSGECGASLHFNGCFHELGLHCRAAGDACRSSDECGERSHCALSMSAQPAREEPAAWGCQRATCVIGRPFTVGGEVRAAALLETTGHWAEIARMEHASVASFARFARELLALGAPPALLAEAFAAAADEVRHAELARALAGHATANGFGPLRVDDLPTRVDVDDFCARLVAEGCVGETLGAAEALASLDGELAPAVRRVLETIAADEQRHAVLAWRTLTWACTQLGADRAAIGRAFERALAEALCVPAEPEDPAHGRLGTRVRGEVRATAARELVDAGRRALGVHSGATRIENRLV
jgi:hypothetical protein